MCDTTDDVLIADPDDTGWIPVSTPMLVRVLGHGRDGVHDDGRDT